MATGHPLIVKSQNFAAAAETTAGTAVAIGASSGKFNFVGDVKLDPNITASVRQSPGSMSKWSAVPGASGADVELTVEVANDGEGSGQPQWFTLLTGCGFSISSATATVASGSASAATFTCGHYIDGMLWSAAGCMFDLEISAESGKEFLAKYTGMGVWQAPTDTALITPTYETGAVPKFENTTLTIGGATYIIPKFALKLNNQVRLREDGASGSGKGYRSAVIYDRDPTFEVEVEASLLATKDWYDLHADRTEGALSLAIGSGTDGIVTIAAPKIQLRNPPVKTVREGLLYYTLLFGLNKSAAAGDDELTIALS